jgi:hypothetical protein
MLKLNFDPAVPAKDGTITCSCQGGAAGGEKHYLSTFRLSKPGVVGRLDSCTVSSFGATPDAPRDEAFMLKGWSSGSLLPPSSFTGMREAGAGDELWTTMAGVEPDSVFLIWLRRELRRERERASALGGGDFNRGEMGQWGVESPEPFPEVDFRGRGTLEGSCVDAGGSWGMLVDDRARWMAAAEGTVALEPARLGPLFGLTSVLLLRESRPVLESAPEDPCWRCGGRAGDVSREDMGEFAVEGEPDTFSEREPLRVWCRIDGTAPLSDAEAEREGEALGRARFVEDCGGGSCEAAMEACDAETALAAGSANSGEPVRERKESSLEIMMDAQLAWGLACWEGGSASLGRMFRW